jgi:pyruvate/2-oxoacid:ferredoxin oxidoreductase beta subunit
MKLINLHDCTPIVAGDTLHSRLKTKLKKPGWLNHFHNRIVSIAFTIKVKAPATKRVVDGRKNKMGTPYIKYATTLSFMVS